MRVGVIAVAVWLAGCFSPNTHTCSDGTVCPAGEVCAPAGGRCVDPGVIAACAGLGSDANCTAVADGVCQDGVCTSTSWTAAATIGGSGGAGTVALSGPGNAAVDFDGDVFVADTGHNRIVELDSTGRVTIVAGSEQGGFSGDGGDASAAALAAPADVAVDGLGNLYIADTGNQRIRKIDTSGVITTIAGNGEEGEFGDGDPATIASLDQPSAVAVDGLGNLYIADTANNLVREINAEGIINPIIQSGVLDQPNGVAVDGNLVVIADSGHNQILEVDPTAPIGPGTVIAGTGVSGGSGDGGSATHATLADPFHVAADAAGDIFFADRENNRIRRISNRVITTVAGAPDGVAGFTGDGGRATAAELDDPYGVAVAPSGALYIADFANNRLREVSPAAVITTALGTGFPVATGDGGAATCVSLNNPSGVAVDGSGALYIADTSDARIRRVDGQGVITTVAGTGILGGGGDGSAAIGAQLTNPVAVGLDAAGDLYIADSGTSTIRRVDTTGTITTFAGNGTQGGGGDGGPATAAELSNPDALAVDAAGNVYIADNTNNRIRRVDTTGTITTFAGGGSGSGLGDNGPATSARLGAPSGVVIDSDGSVYIADAGNHRVRRVSPSGTITTFAGTGIAGSAGDGSAATAAELSSPQSVALDGNHDLYIADSASNVVRRVDAAGVITTVAGTGDEFFDGDGGSATSAKLNGPCGVAADAAGTLYVADLGNERIRRVDASGVITTVAGGPVDPAQMGPVAQARLPDPRALAASPGVTLFAGGNTGTVQLLAGSAVSTIAGRYPQPDPSGVRARFQDSGFGVVAGIAYDAADGLIYITESTAQTDPSVFSANDAGNQILTVTIGSAGATAATLAQFANVSGDAGFADGTAGSASFGAPTGLYFDPAGPTLYVADTGNQLIRMIDLAGSTMVTTIAGTPVTVGFAGDGSAATSALLFDPQAITLCGNGDLFIADTGNNRVRRIDTTGAISTVLGDGSVSSSGEGSPASTFPVDAPLGLACDSVGNLFVTSTTVVRMLVSDASGVVDGTGAVRTIYGVPPREFPASVTRCLTGLAVLDDSTVEVTDACTGLMVQLTRQTSP